MPNTRLITAEFAYHRPKRIEDALTLLALPGARVLAGGTDILIRMKMGEVRAAALVQVVDIPELRVLEFNSALAIGAAVPLYQLEEEPRLAERFSALHEAVLSLGSVQVRAMATLAGNLCNASPAADLAGPLMALGAEVEIASISGGRVERRSVSVESFFTGPGTTVLRPGEMLVAVHVPQQSEGSGSAFLKLGRVSMDISKMSASAWVQRKGEKIAAIRLALGGVAPRPVRPHGVEEALCGASFGPQAVAQALQRVQESISPIDDVRSTAEYRREMSGLFLGDAIRKAWLRAGKEKNV